MKLPALTIIAAAIQQCVRSGEAAAPRLRINNYKEVAVTADAEEEVAAADLKKRSKTATSSPSRERISNYVQTGQMFFLIANQTILFEDPSTDPMSFTNIFWFCQPTTAPDLNGDGMYDSVISHANIAVPPAISKAAVKKGASLPETFFSTEGYTASWVKESQSYKELVADFGDTSVWEIHNKEFVGYETSLPGGKGGMVSSGEGEWTFDTSHPLLTQLSESIGTELTPETCAERYAKTWNASHPDSNVSNEEE